MKLSKTKKCVFYLIFWGIVLFIFYLALLFFLKFFNLVKEDKWILIIKITIIIGLFAFIIYLSLLIDFFINAYLLIDDSKKNLIENFPIISKFLFNKYFKFFLYTFSVFIVWNFSLYIKEISNSILITCFLFISQIINKKEEKYNILKAFIVAIFIYFFSHFLKNEPQFKIWNNKFNLPEPDYIFYFSVARAALYTKFYIYIEKIIRPIAKKILKESQINKKNKK